MCITVIVDEMIQHSYFRNKNLHTWKNKYLTSDIEKLRN